MGEKKEDASSAPAANFSFGKLASITPSVIVSTGVATEARSFSFGADPSSYVTSLPSKVAGAKDLASAPASSYV